MTQSNITLANTLGFLQFGLRRTKTAPLRALLALSRQRTQLAELDATRLADIGVSAEQACVEANRPFWDAPSSWLR